MAEIGKIYADAGKWSSIDPPATRAGPLTSAWKVIDGDGKPWTVTITVDDVADQNNKHLVKIGVVRAALRMLKPGAKATRRLVSCAESRLRRQYRGLGPFHSGEIRTRINFLQSTGLQLACALKHRIGDRADM
jgi:hypothetical protein